ncbi:MAG: ABC transporter ATP-binding protein [Thermogemmatispora sp.]|jgi:ABC-2 type transport system ATP-binding protein|uniref:ABC transporter ATP-binding protein n=1 Tax=Thermogemmatispora aurantia TaxID=2045279 RepID=A0A5J4K4T8_9CHLR|nr:MULTISPECIES: ABC transporter ATP-binding protein [Thermogemmatispora]MBE3564733.1 ABC transporter ATP-binding protein [Thermogemmatispora sp.]GER82523.1 ABC transporter ATP-binding protein [Thermogemmatispora aurantia]
MHSDPRQFAVANPFRQEVEEWQREAAIVTRDLVRVFGQKVAVNHLNLVVKRGEFFGFLGPNGAGKSTTIKMMVGLLRPTTGRVWVAGVDVWREPLQARRLMGVLPEQLNLYERLTGREFLTFTGHMYELPKGEIERRSSELLRLLALEEDADKLIIDYSVGMRKKIALAAALIHNPQVLFLDEPFEGIDPVSSRVIRDILQDLTRRGTTIFFSSHIMELVERLCSRVGIINQGVLVAEGTLQELRARASGTGDMPRDATLEDIFLNVIGVRNEEHNLSWLE